MHLDIWGPFSVESVEGYRYFLNLVDDCTRVNAHELAFTDNAHELALLLLLLLISTVFTLFLKHISTQYNMKIKAIRSDNAHELAFTDLIKELDMFHYFSCAYIPQQNSVTSTKLSC